MCPTWRHIAVVLCAAFGLHGQIGSCFAQSPARPGSEPGGSLLSPQAEARIGEALRRAVTQGGGGAPKILAGRKIASLTYREAMQKGLDNNLGVQFQKQAMVEAGAAAEVKKAAFDPVTSLATNYLRNVGNDRGDVITRVRRQVPDFESLQQQFQKQLETGSTGGGPDLISACTVIVDGKQVLNGFAYSRPECANVATTIYEGASFKGLRPDESLAFYSQGSKLTGYGGLISLAFQTGYFPKTSAFVATTAADVALIDRTNAYVSTISFGFTTPLPFGKNFGPYGTRQAADLKLSQVQIERSGFEHDLVSNNTLLAVDNAYWDLVASLKVLQITRDQKEILDQLQKRAQSYFKLGEINEYSKNQVEARLSGMLGREALAWNGLIAASETLSNLLNGDIAELLLPVAYQESLESMPSVDPELALRNAMERNLDIKRSQALLEESQILLSHRINQAKPDLTLSASLSLGQSNGVFGYPNIGRSLMNTFNPDIRTMSIGLTYRIPLGNAAAKAALGQARVGVMQARDQLTQSRNQIVQQLSASMDALQSGLKQTELSRINMKLAEDAFGAASRRRALNLITEFELLEIQSDLLNARLSHIGALVEYRKNAARVLASQNMLAASVKR